MLRYFISLFFILGGASGYAQDRPIDLNRQDTVEYKQPYGIRAGIDMSRILVSFLEDRYTGLEIVGDYRLTQKLYIAAELGNEKKTIGVDLGNKVNTTEGELYDFTASGSYIKAGIDYNTYGNWYGEQNMIYIGGRYAFSSFSQTVNDYKIFDTSRYWNPDDFPIGTSPNKEFTGLTASWLEFVVGIKAEMIKNLYFGASVRLAFLVSNKDPDNFQNQFIPGFNKVTEGSKFGVGYNYSITYLIPLYKKANVPREKKKKEVDAPVEGIPSDDVPIDETPENQIPSDENPGEDVGVPQIDNGI
ncbi:hypothetical protein SAMN05421636_10610 [Pricia antarctica]|uniref:Uncharacterized protein n=1 Tax=Pricia antarctica TaxID=641691 RepID=A0A1G7E3E1_9FLAO|nr:DUF6048 family protein [Pricia antarctica]SDE58233.1 hypothetical protein SAMN05421636_10610 [Pricia antarctica]